MSKGPIKRDENIVSLSREHHFSLLFGWKIKNGFKFGIDPERINKYALHFWENNLTTHFKQEEETLFAVTKDKMVDRALDEHRQIRAEVAILKNPSSKEELKIHLLRIADLVTDHVRFEERELFPHLEKKLTPEQLKSIGHDLNEMLDEPLQDDYEDQFWVKKKESNENN